MNWFTRYAYNENIGFLDRYLKSPISPHDYADRVRGYLDDLGEPYDEAAFDNDEIAAADQWIEKASPDEKEDFLRHVTGEEPPMGDFFRPIKETFQYRKLAKPGWLVHFTNDPWGIARQGFVYGHDDIEGLHLTTEKSEKARRSRPGFNFAFDINSKYSTWAARDHKYGKHAVVFWAAGVEAYHYGDEENQIIFWGPSVKTDMIFPIEHQNGDWVANDARGTPRITGEFDDVAEWVTKNYRLLQQVEKRVDNQQRERLREHDRRKMQSDELERFDTVIVP